MHHCAPAWSVDHSTSTQEALEHSLAPFHPMSRCTRSRSQMFFSSYLSGVPNMQNCHIPSAQCINKFELLPVRAPLQHSLDLTAKLSIPQRSLWTTSACPECACRCFLLLSWNAVALAPLHSRDGPSLQTTHQAHSSQLPPHHHRYV